VHVLVVEDDVRLAEALARILEDNGYIVDTVHDGQAGIDYGRSGTYDVIILDVMLPSCCSPPATPPPTRSPGWMRAPTTI